MVNSDYSNATDYMMYVPQIQKGKNRKRKILELMKYIGVLKIIGHTEGTKISQ